MEYHILSDVHVQVMCMYKNKLIIKNALSTVLTIICNNLTSNAISFILDIVIVHFILYNKQSLYIYLNNNDKKDQQLFRELYNMQINLSR